MTTYIFHGGNTFAVSSENTWFFEKILQAVPKANIHILFIPFAREKERWSAGAKKIEERFTEVRSERTLIFDIADEGIDALRIQIQISDIVFIWGGDTQKLQKNLEEIPDLETLFEGKVVAGTSAGALVLTKYYYENDTDSFHPWLAILPIKCICHWKNEKWGLLDVLKTHGNPDDEILTLAEWEYEIMKK